MPQQLREHFASIVLRPPFLPRRWLEYRSIHLPILEPALPDSALGRLLTFRTLDAIHRRKPSRAAAKRLYKLHFLCREDRPADRALYNFLCGMYAEMLGNVDEMARRFRIAAKFSHTYHLMYAKLGLYYLLARHRYDQAEAYLNQAIDCIYKYPPLDEAKRRSIAVLQSGMARALLMMHRTGEAEAMLDRAAPAADTAEYLHAQALLQAVQGRSAEALQALTALRPHSETLCRICEDNVRLILDGTHPHFTAKEPDHAAIAAYWAWFVQAESDLLWRLSNGDNRSACYQLHAPHFDPLTPEPEHIDRMAVGFRLTDGQPQLRFHDYHSRNYAALIDALISACPPDIRSRWEIIRNPESIS